MPSDGRTEEEIRREIASEREQLAEALADLRVGLGAKRRVAAAVAGTVAVGLAALTGLRLVRRLRSG